MCVCISGRVVSVSLSLFSKVCDRVVCVCVFGRVVCMCMCMCKCVRVCCV